MKISPPFGNPFPVNVRRCSACGADHDNLYVGLLSYNVGAEHVLSTVCPATGTTLVVTITEA